MNELKRQVMRVLAFGMRGKKPTPEVLKLVSEGLGGVILFRENIGTSEEVRQLNQALHAASPEGLLVSVDQEGGIVRRLVHETITIPGAMTLGAIGDLGLVYEVAYKTGEALLALGFNQNYAPVLDVNNNPLNPVIGVRSFGKDPEMVARMGVAALSGLQAAGVLATGKHFPGHGDTAVDSHLALPRVDHGQDRLRAVELLPFREAIRMGIGSIMTAHILFPAIEPDLGKPATLSNKVLTDLLKNELGFAGLVVTDALEMKAIAAQFGPIEAAIKALVAGADQVLIAHAYGGLTYEEVVAGVYEAVCSGRISEDRLMDAVTRVERAYQKTKSPFSCDVDFEYEKKIAGIYERSLTRVGAVAAAQPRGVVLFTPTAISLVEDAAESERWAELLAPTSAPWVKVLPLDPDASDIAAIKHFVANQECLVVTHDLLRHSGQKELIETLTTPPVVLAARNPYDVLQLDLPYRYTLYENTPLALVQAIAHLSQTGEADGRLPL